MNDVPLRGTFKVYSLPKVLITINRMRTTGTLTVTSGNINKRIFVKKGEAVFASSNYEDDRLGEMLLKAGKITVEQYDKSVEMLKKTKMRQGAILVKLGYLSPKDLFWGVKFQVSEIIMSLFQFEDAGYDFEEGSIPEDEVITLNMSMGNLIFEGVKRIGNWTRIRREIPEMDTVVQLSNDPLSLFQNVEFTQQDRKILSLVDGKRQIKQIIEESWLNSFEAMKTVYLLISIGIVIPKVKDESSPLSVDELLSPVSAEGGDDDFVHKLNSVYERLSHMSPHEILEVDKNASLGEVQKSYFRLAKEYHPDRYYKSKDNTLRDRLAAVFDALTDAYNKVKHDFETGAAQAAQLTEPTIDVGALSGIDGLDVELQGVDDKEEDEEETGVYSLGEAADIPGLDSEDNDIEIPSVETPEGLGQSPVIEDIDGLGAEEHDAEQEQDFKFGTVEIDANGIDEPVIEELDDGPMDVPVPGLEEGGTEELPELGSIDTPGPEEPAFEEQPEELPELGSIDTPGPEEPAFEEPAEEQPEFGSIKMADGDVRLGTEEGSEEQPDFGAINVSEGDVELGREEDTINQADFGSINVAEGDVELGHEEDADDTPELGSFDISAGSGQPGHEDGVEDTPELGTFDISAGGGELGLEEDAGEAPEFGSIDTAAGGGELGLEEDAGEAPEFGSIDTAAGGGELGLEEDAGEAPEFGSIDIAAGGGELGLEEDAGEAPEFGSIDIAAGGGELGLEEDAGEAPEFGSIDTAAGGGELGLEEDAGEAPEFGSIDTAAGGGELGLEEDAGEAPEFGSIDTAAGGGELGLEEDAGEAPEFGSIDTAAGGGELGLEEDAGEAPEFGSIDIAAGGDELGLQQDAGETEGSEDFVTDTLPAVDAEAFADAEDFDAGELELPGEPEDFNGDIGSPDGIEEISAEATDTAAMDEPLVEDVSEGSFLPSEPPSVGPALQKPVAPPAQKAPEAAPAKPVLAQVSAEKATQADALYREGIGLLKSGELKGAASKLEQAALTNPNNPDYWNYLTLALTKLPGRFQDAEMAIKKAISIDPENSDLYANMGLMYMKSKMNPKAIDSFKKSLALNPENKKAKKGLSQLGG